jgi:3-oxoacyl-[acyl-carrier protein] reductase
MTVPAQRRALVTGAASGLTAGIASALARDGFSSMAITYYSTDPQSVLRAIRETGVQAHAARVDFCEPAAKIETALAQLIEELGPFDTVVHGVGWIDVRRFEHFDIAAYDEAFAVNLRSAVLVAAAVLPAMRAARFGRIVIFGGNGSSQTAAHPGMTLYQASKSALTAFAKTLAIEEARHGITVNVIEPGDIRDKQRSRESAHALPAANPRGRPGSVDDVSDVVRFLAAPQRDFVTGAVIGVTGGLTAADERNAHRS